MRLENGLSPWVLTPSPAEGRGLGSAKAPGLDVFQHLEGMGRLQPRPRWTQILLMGGGSAQPYLRAMLAEPRCNREKSGDATQADRRH